MSLTLAEANRAIDASLAKARELEIKISVSVGDMAGRLVAHQRMDGAFAEAPWASIGKRQSEPQLRGSRTRPD